MPLNPNQCPLNYFYCWGSHMLGNLIHVIPVHQDWDALLSLFRWFVHELAVLMSWQFKK